MAWIGAAIAGGAGLLGGALSNSGGSAANKWTRDAAESQMNYQTTMSNSAYQRQVADLKAAGINPMLGYMKGAPASTPSGAMAEARDTMTPAVNSASTVFRTGMEGQLMSAGVDKTKAETDLARSGAAKNAADAAVAAALVPKLQGETLNVSHTGENIQADTAIKRQEAFKIMAEMDKVISETSVNEAQREHLMAQVRLAAKQGRVFDAQTGNLHADSALRRLSWQLMAKTIPQMSNEERAQGSWWMENVSPYLPDILKGTSSAATVRGLVK